MECFEHSEHKNHRYRVSVEKVRLVYIVAMPYL